MQSQVETLKDLEYRLSRWDEDMRFGCRGLEQLTRVLQDVRAPAPESTGDFSSDDLAEVLYPERLATFRMLAMSLLGNISRLLNEIGELEASGAAVARRS